MKVNMFAIVIFLIVSVSLVYPQEVMKKYLAQTNKYEVKEIYPLGDSILVIKDEVSGKTYYKNIKERPIEEDKNTADLIIDLNTIDLSQWDGLYRYWVDLPITSYHNVVIVDADQNGHYEIYGNYDYSFYPLIQGGRIYELRDSSIYPVYSFAFNQIRHFRALGDITRDGLLDVIGIKYNYGQSFLKQDTLQGLINVPNFVYEPFASVHQVDCSFLFDVDSDGTQELIYSLRGANSPDSALAASNHVAKYNRQLNNYELIYYHRPKPDWYTYGFSRGDFDNDGKNNFATGSVNGKFYVYEHVNGNEYKVEYDTTIPTYNAYLSVMTDDLNGNGKPEVWIGGDFSSSVYGGITRLMAYETTGFESYEKVYQIDIRGLFSLDEGVLRTGDIDGDGKKDLLLYSGPLIFSFKYNEVNNFYLDFIVKDGMFDSTGYSIGRDGFDIHDFGTGDAKLVNLFRITIPHGYAPRGRTVIMKRNGPSSTREHELPLADKYTLFQNFPNPFNSETTIKFYIPETTIVKIKIYNIYGEEITELLNQNLYRGEHSINWDGKNSLNQVVTSGIYLIVMDTGKIKSTIKTILLK